MPQLCKALQWLLLGSISVVVNSCGVNRGGACADFCPAYDHSKLRIANTDNTNLYLRYVLDVPDGNIVTSGFTDVTIPGGGVLELTPSTTVFNHLYFYSSTTYTQPNELGKLILQNTNPQVLNICQVEVKTGSNHNPPPSTIDIAGATGTGLACHRNNFYATYEEQIPTGYSDGVLGCSRWTLKTSPANMFQHVYFYYSNGTPPCNPTPTTKMAGKIVVMNTNANKIKISSIVVR